MKESRVKEKSRYAKRPVSQTTRLWEDLDAYRRFTQHWPNHLDKSNDPDHPAIVLYEKSLGTQPARRPRLGRRK